MPLARALALLALFVAPALGQDDPQVKTAEFDSPSVGRTMKYQVALPKGYDASPNRRYPVLYLLHGYTSNYRDWARLGAAKAAEPYDLIVVMADGGNSWYVNWSKSEGDAKNAWEDSLIKDLIPHIDATYRTVASREGRGINGLSMGGYGALTLGLRHPDLFATVGSHSGAIGIAHEIAKRRRAGEDFKPGNGRRPSDTPNPALEMPDFDSQAERSPKGEMFATPEEADAHDPFELVTKVERKALPHLYIDCGTEDFLYDSNREFVRLLLDKKIPFTFAETPGGHTPPYWSREIFLSMAAQYQVLHRGVTKAADAPSD